MSAKIQWAAAPTAGHDVHGQSAICDEHTGRTVAIVYDGDAHAAFIARACNAYDELLEALDRVTNQLAHKYPNDEAWEQARAALAKARGGSR